MHNRRKSFTRIELLACPAVVPCASGGRRQTRAAVTLIEPFDRLKARSFTLLELLVVIAIIAILASMLLPTLARAKLAAKNAICLGNQRSVGQAFNLYRTDYNGRACAGADSEASDEPSALGVASFGDDPAVTKSQPVSRLRPLRSFEQHPALPRGHVALTERGQTGANFRRSGTVAVPRPSTAFAPSRTSES